MARTRSNDYDKKRQAILRRSARLFARHGFSGASIGMIADECGMSKALMYHYYGSKDDVLNDLLTRHLQDLVDAVEAADRSGASPAQRLLAIAAALLNSYRGADAEHEVQITSLKLLPRAQQEVLKSKERRLVTIVADVIAEAHPAIAKRNDVLKPLTMSFFGMLNWHYLWFREGGGMTRGAYARMASDLILSGAAKLSPTADAGAPRAPRIPRSAKPGKAASNGRRSNGLLQA